MDRRDFLGAVSLLTTSLGRVPTAAPFLERVGLQLFTVRSLMRADVPGTLERVRDVGYTEVEFAGYFGLQPGQVRSLLSNVGLAAPSAHVSLPELRDNLERTLDAAAEVGHRYVVLGSPPVAMRGSVEAYREIAALLNRVGSAARARSMRVAYHNHAFEFPPINGSVPFEILLGETDPGLVGLQMDLYWIRRAGQDALAYLERSPGRFVSFHVKDMDASGGFADVGKGIIDFRSVLGSRFAAGVQHYFVEHDESPDPMASIKTSFDYLNQLAT